MIPSPKKELIDQIKDVSSTLATKDLYTGWQEKRG